MSFSHNVHIVHPYLDKQKFYKNLNFVGMVNVYKIWYSPYIRSSSWLKVFPENMYLEFLCLIAENCKGLSSDLQNIPLLKYVSSSNNTYLESVSNNSIYTIMYLFSKDSNIWWMTKWSRELGSSPKNYFILGPSEKEIINLDSQEG